MKLKCQNRDIFRIYTYVCIIQYEHQLFLLYLKKMIFLVNYSDFVNKFMFIIENHFSNSKRIGKYAVPKNVRLCI